MIRRIRWASGHRGSEDSDQTGVLSVVSCAGNADGTGPVHAAIIGAQETGSTEREMRKVIEQAEKTLLELRTGEEYSSLGDSHQTHANIKMHVEEMKKRLDLINEELKDVRRTRAESGKDNTCN
ncbi:uncharacterized protein LOC127833901 [Dreissena polymorpha]|uniref:uncharacterized protein LOC127833901 n=1 Tax=Dreissena polymorpha TaxID=45954 RepID=UPI002264235B|nr:uncharacterized protein LOC127833901 [Dreissena polymorpha]